MYVIEMHPKLLTIKHSQKHLHTHIHGYFHGAKFRESVLAKNFHFNIWLFIVMKTSKKKAKLSHREYPHLVKNCESIILYRKYKAYTVHLNP